MTAKNEITGDSIISRPATDSYREGYDRVFSSWEQEVTLNPLSEGAMIISVPSNKGISLKLTRNEFRDLCDKITHYLQNEEFKR